MNPLNKNNCGTCLWWGRDADWKIATSAPCYHPTLDTLRSLPKPKAIPVFLIMDKEDDRDCACYTRRTNERKTPHAPEVDPH